MSIYRLACSNNRIGEVALAEEPVSLGRHPENTIPLIEDDVASRFHCVIEPNGGGFVLKDLGSRNGTRVNGERVTEYPLNAGDVITVGKHTFEVKVEQEAPQLFKKKGRETARGAAPAWAIELRSILDSLPPKSVLDENITIIDAAGKPSDALISDGEGPQAMRLMLILAQKSRATDIHFEPKGENFTIRVRVDGQMVSIVDLPNMVGELCLGLVRAACQMRQAGREAVLDGHFGCRFRARRVDYRASLTPTVHGQKLVLRILDSLIAPQNLSDLHIPTFMYDRLKKVTQQETGLLLVSGPTGSGKTTTLYNAIREIDRKTSNVITIEDPVEYSLEGVTQIPVTQNTSFSDILRSVLRQDPDVILVGEIRDEETARVAMQAAMTGHVVFSTVHAKDTIGAVFRLLDLGVEGYLVANSLDVVVAQRLVRVLCESCRRPVRVTPGQATRIGRFLEGKTEVFAATGCPRCLRTGYHGRRAIFEMLEFNDDLRDCILHSPSIQKMKGIIEQGVFTTLQQSGWVLASRGMTTLDEVERVTG
ncbi:MAG TPA: ATPase, T2SS/T4P/T4SS family [Phycisphaerales bacterium]|nr:ATPase, T2SS/T4P/T4SS family [Phycisphaerales bacterium]